MSWNKILGLILTLIYGSCNLHDPPANLSAQQLERLLSADSSKTWLLTNRIDGAFDPCESDDVLIFIKPSAVNDTSTIRFETGPVFCPGQMDSLIFQGTWDIIDGMFSDTLTLLIAGDTTKRSIDLATSQQLNISFLQGNSLIRENYISLD